MNNEIKHAASVAHYGANTHSALTVESQYYIDALYSVDTVNEAL